MYLIVNKLCPLSLSLLLPVLTGGTVASQITNLSTKQWACKSFALRHPLFLLPSCLPTFSHFVSVNKTSLSLPPSLSQLPAGCSLNPAAKCCRQPGSRLPSGANVEVPPRSLLGGEQARGACIRVFAKTHARTTRHGAEALHARRGRGHADCYADEDTTRSRKAWASWSWVRVWTATAALAVSPKD